MRGQIHSSFPEDFIAVLTFVLAVREMRKERGLFWAAGL
uniref:Uncharacterized protein n=1 Tax=Anguilla anguilla TaxID=7936 RepID=A0A0E9VME9_ANGAN